MILSLRPDSAAPIPGSVPLRRRVIVIGATDAGVATAFHLGKSALLLEQRGVAPSGVRRWQPPDLRSAAPTWDQLWLQLETLLSGEVKLSCQVIAIDAGEHRLQVSTGESFIYDKLVSTLRIDDLQRLIIDEQPSHLRGADWWRCWLSGRDIEVLDASAQLASGDVDGETAGKRVAERLGRAMTAKFARSASRAQALFQPRVVSGV